MTPEQQRIAIAEAFGLTNVAPMIVKNVKYEGDDITVGIWSDDGWVPQYLIDLNAMNEAEELFYAKSDTLEGAERMRDYSRWLCNIAKYPLRAKAAQRAEAFLRTIGKWEESQ